MAPPICQVTGSVLKGGRLPSWVFMVVVKVNVYAAKLEIIEAKCD